MRATVVRFLHDLHNITVAKGEFVLALAGEIIQCQVEVLPGRRRSDTWSWSWTTFLAVSKDWQRHDVRIRRGFEDAMMTDRSGIDLIVCQELP